MVGKAHYLTVLSLVIVHRRLKDPVPVNQARQHAVRLPGGTENSSHDLDGCIRLPVAGPCPCLC